MRIVSLHLQNIKSHRDTSLTFSPGINVLSGANGAGKSTVFEAIGYALFGVDAQEFVSNVSRFISIGAKSGKIAVVFECDAGEVWRVSRTVGAASKWLLEKKTGDDFEVEEHARIEETGARLAELLGLANGRPLGEQFRLVIGPFQNEFLGPFIIRQVTKRQEAFDEILGIDTWRKTFKGTSSLLTAVQDRIKNLSEMIELLQHQLAVLPERERERDASIGMLAAAKAELEEKVAMLKGLQERVSLLDERERALSVMAKDIEALEKRITDGTATIEVQKELVADTEKAVALVEENREGKRAFDAAESRLTKLRTQEQQRRTLEKAIGELEMEARDLLAKTTHEAADIRKLDTELDDEHERLATLARELLAKSARTEDTAILGELLAESDRVRTEKSLLEGRLEGVKEGKEKLASGICPFFQEECKNIEGGEARDLFTTKTEDLEQKIASLGQRISALALQLQRAEAAVKAMDADKVRLQEVEKQLLELEKKRSGNRLRLEPLELLRKKHSDAERRVESRKSELRAFLLLDTEIEAAESERVRFKEASAQFTANQNVAGELESRRENFDRWSAALEGLKNDLEGKRVHHALSGREYSLEEHQALQQERERVVAEVATRQQQIFDTAKSIERLQMEVVALRRVEADVEAKKSAIALLEEKERMVRFLRNQVFKNVSAQLSERFREEITLRADRIYRTIAESDEELVWGENYQIILRDMAAGAVRERSDDQLSGGQTMSAVVALRLALLQTIGARIAFFDEPTSNLDASRRENLAHAFRAIDVGREEVTEHWYDQLFLISHDVAFTEITDQIISIDERS